MGYSGKTGLTMAAILMVTSVSAGELVSPAMDWSRVMADTVTATSDQLLQQSLEQQIEQQAIEMHLELEQTQPVRHSVMEPSTFPDNADQFTQKKPDGDCLG